MTPPRRPHPHPVEELLHHYGEASGRFGRRMAHELGVHHTDLDAIAVLHGAPEPLTVSELGRALQLSSAAVTAVVDRLERAGHLVRQRDDSDRRKVHLAPTTRLDGAVHTMIDPFVALLRARLAELDPADLDAAARVLDAALDALRALEEGDPPSRVEGGTAQPELS